jgi:dTDP-4-dehydrorhamnose 3,5-epimerase
MQNELQEISLTPYLDSRGIFTKIVNEELTKHVMPKVSEVYVTSSHKNTIRGLHYQTGGFGQDKLIYCISGALLDITVDLQNAETIGRVQIKKLSTNNPTALFIPKGYAHGIISLEENTVFCSINSTPYSPENECGIRWDTLGVNFDVSDPIVTEKDKNWPSLAEVIK